MRDAVTYTEHSRRKTVRQGARKVGAGGWRLLSAARGYVNFQDVLFPALGAADRTDAAVRHARRGGHGVPRTATRGAGKQHRSQRKAPRSRREHAELRRRRVYRASSTVRVCPRGAEVTALDVVYALKRQGKTIYGFGAARGATSTAAARSGTVAGRRTGRLALLSPGGPSCDAAALLGGAPWAPGLLRRVRARTSPRHGHRRLARSPRGRGRGRDRGLPQNSEGHRARQSQRRTFPFDCTTHRSAFARGCSLPVRCCASRVCRAVSVGRAHARRRAWHP